jgi:hypothetical protein
MDHLMHGVIIDDIEIGEDADSDSDFKALERAGIAQGNLRLSSDLYRYLE